MRAKAIFSALLGLALASCGRQERQSVFTEYFGDLSSGEKVSLYHLKNSSGASLTLCDYGARVVSIKVPDRNGVLADVVVGPGSIEAFEKGDRFFGCIIGRYGNRINHAAFTLDGKKYFLNANEYFDGEPVQCHGGSDGFDRHLWNGEIVKESGKVSVRFNYLSPDGEQGFPGNLDVSVSYFLEDDNSVRIVYEATTDKPTVVNLSNHSYFNLRGAERGSYVMEELLQVNADTCVQNNSHFCPDILLSVEGTPFDFREPHRVDYRIDMPSKQLQIMHGMSACWKLRSWDGTLRNAATLYDPVSGRGVEVWTTEPALLTFTGRSFSREAYPYGKYGPIDKFTGMLLETIHFPDSPNQPRFPSTVLRPGEKYHSETVFHFIAK